MSVALCRYGVARLNLSSTGTRKILEFGVLQGFPQDSPDAHVEKGCGQRLLFPKGLSQSAPVYTNTEFGLGRRKSYWQTVAITLLHVPRPGNKSRAAMAGL